MNRTNAGPAVEPLLPVELGSGRIRFAQGVKAGPWVFISGLMGQDFVHGVSPKVLNQHAPNSELPKLKKEAFQIFEHLDAVLKAAGADRSNLVRTDQYYTTVKAVPPYQSARREFLNDRIPPSTSITQRRFVLPDADISVQAIGVNPYEGFAPKHLEHDQLQGRPTSGYPAALSVGDYIFVPGMTSMATGDEAHRNGVAEAALMKEGAQWGGQPIQLETEFIINQRIAPSLELAGAKLQDVVKAQVYLTQPADYAAFNETWVKHFGRTGPALSVIPCVEQGLAPIDGTIEINILALKSNGDTKKQQIEADVMPGLFAQPLAVKAGDLLLLSALMATEKGGLAGKAAIDPRQPWFTCSAQAQAECIIEHAQKICSVAGAAIENVVRIQLFLTDISEFYPIYKVWEQILGGRPVPFSVVEVPAPLPLPDASVLMDIWIYAP